MALSARTARRVADDVVQCFEEVAARQSIQLRKFRGGNRGLRSQALDDANVDALVDFRAALFARLRGEFDDPL